MSSSRDDQRFIKQFNCTDGQEPIYVENGRRLLQVWKILNKYTLQTKGGETHYEIQFWEAPEGYGNEVPNIQMIPENEALRFYGGHIELWEEDFGELWNERYARDGDIFNHEVKRKEYTPNKATQVDKRPRFQLSDKSSNDELEDDPIDNTPPDLGRSQDQVRPPSQFAQRPSFNINVGQQTAMAPPPRS